MLTADEYKTAEDTKKQDRKTECKFGRCLELKTNISNISCELSC
jgi:hypothetical protein